MGALSALYNIEASSLAGFVHARAGRTNKPRPPRNTAQ